MPNLHLIEDLSRALGLDYRPGSADLLEDLLVLLEGGPAKPGTVHHRKDGDYKKQNDGTWQKQPTNSSDEPYKLKTPKKNAPKEKGENEWDKLKTSTATLAQLAKTHPELSKKTLGEHVKIAKDVTQKHAVGFRKLEKKMRGLMVGEGTHFKGRTKKLESALGKLVRKPKGPDKKGEVSGYAHSGELTDVTGTRVVCNSIDDVKKNIEVMKKSFKPAFGGEWKDGVNQEDYITKPKDNYRSYHLLIEDEDGLVKEVQIRTENQNTFADWAHKIYKPENQEQREAMGQHSKEISKYAEAMSELYYQKDIGKPGGKPPPCPEPVKQSFGCLPAD